MVASYPESIIGFRGALIESIQSLGIQVHILFPNSKNEETCCKLAKMGVVVHDYKINRKGTSIIIELWTIFSLCTKIINIKPDILFSYTIKPVIYSGLLSFFYPVSTSFALITGLGYAFQNQKNRRNLTQVIAQNLYRFSLKKVTKVFFQNPDDEQLFRERRLLKKQKSSVVVNGSGVDIEAFHPCDLPPNFSFLLIARLIKAKGIFEFLEAAKSISQKYKNVSFKLVGRSETGFDSITQEQRSELVNNHSIEFLGSLDDVRSAISSSSVYVLPSYREGTPRTVLEAMAMGRAIITTDVPGCRETVIDGHNGYLVPPRDSKALIQAMHRFLDNPALAMTMGKRSRELVVEKYDVQKVNYKMLKEMNLLE